MLYFACILFEMFNKSDNSLCFIIKKTVTFTIEINEYLLFILANASIDKLSKCNFYLQQTSVR